MAERHRKGQVPALCTRHGYRGSYLLASPPFLVLITTSWVFWLALGLSIFTVVACAVWKDYIHDEEADKKDVYVTIAGGATVWIVALLAYIL